MNLATSKAAQNALEILVNSINKQNKTSYDLSPIFEADPSDDTVPLLDHWLGALDTAVESFRQCIEARKYVLYKRRNAKLPIHRLPEELFCDILSYVVDAYSDLLIPRLQELASVSTRWWITVVNTPRLWTLVHQEDDVTLLLRKSAGCSLRVLHLANRQAIGFLSIVGQHAERWRSLLSRSREDEVGGRELALHTYAPYIQRSLNTLEELEIVQAPSLSSTMPPVVEAPRLHRINLTHVRLHPTTIFTNISVLKLICCTGVSPSALTRVLASSPGLEELEVECPRSAANADVQWRDMELDSLDDLPQLHHVRILRLRAVCMRVALHLLRRIPSEKLSKLELVHYFSLDLDSKPLLHSYSEGPTLYRSFITAAFTRQDIRCVKWDLVAPTTQINLLGLRALDHCLPTRGAVDTVVEVCFHNLWGYRATIDYLLPITQAMSAPLLLWFDSVKWTPNPIALLMLSSLSRMTIVTGPSHDSRSVRDLLTVLASPHTESDD
ncbi:hypothetical protein FRB99_005003 [Tulasnella sp. 403]|nr:hypothetical protein FRB99_005003 [Tulasnella sp. 403]